MVVPPMLPYCPTKDESLLLIESGDKGGLCIAATKGQVSLPGAAAQGWI